MRDQQTQTHTHIVWRHALVVLSLLLMTCLTGRARAEDFTDRQFAFDIPAQPLSSAILSFSAQTGVQIITDGADVSVLKTNGVSGQLSISQALTRLLTGTGLQHRAVGKTAVALKRSGRSSTTETQAASATRIAQGDTSAQSPSADPDMRRVELEEVRVTIPEVLVVGSKILNMDIPRTRDDPQPYVIFERESIERSGATNLEEFLKQRLPMNTVAGTQAQSPTASLGNVSEINLRGLGSNQTLILIDGHRAAPVYNQGVPRQTDLNGIPLAAIERIEVLPTTASGIYGGAATGGVVNIILRRDYNGAELKVTYDNAFDTDAAIRRVDFSTGFTLEDGKTSALLAGSWSDANVLRVLDRDLVQRGRTALIANNGSSLLPPNTPPVGSTPNIRSANGSPLFGPGTPSFTSVPVGYSGGGGLEPLRANAGQYNLGLDNGIGRQGILNAPTIESGMATVRREFSPSVEAFLELGASNNSGFFPRFGTGTFTIAADAPNNPFNQSIIVTVPTTWAGEVVSRNSDRRAVGGIILRLPGNWMAEADYTWNQSRFTFSSPPSALAANGIAAIGNGTLDVLRDLNAAPPDFVPYTNAPTANSPLRSTLQDATLRLAGPVGSLPAGRPTLSLLLEHRDERFSDSYQFQSAATFYFPSRSQTTKSAYLEMRLPVVAADSRLKLLRELEVQLAGRVDDYSVNGVTGNVNTSNPIPIVRTSNSHTSTNPTLGLRVKPLPDLMLRASYGTGFLPPAVNQLNTNAPQSFDAGVIDPRRGNTNSGPVQIIGGGNADLEPEESESSSIGVVLTPRLVPGLRVSVDYTRIDKTGNIATIAGQVPQPTVDNESLFPDRVVRGPVSPGDPFDVGPITTVYTTLVNLARTEVEAYDAAIDYQWEGNFGILEFFASATWQTHFKTQLLPSQPLVENVGVTTAFPLKFKASGGISWRRGEWQAGWNARHFDSYIVSTNATVITNQGGSQVSSQTCHDVFANYRFGRDGSNPITSGTELQIGVRNIFNEEPPLDMSGANFYSVYGDPRLATYYISLKKEF